MTRGSHFLLALMLLVLLTGSFLAACGGAGEQADATAAEREKATAAAAEGKALLEERCARCHDLGRVERASKTADEWRATVDRMVLKGTQLSQADEELVTQYLSDTYGP